MKLLLKLPLKPISYRRAVDPSVVPPPDNRSLRLFLYRLPEKYGESL